LIPWSLIGAFIARRARKGSSRHGSREYSRGYFYLCAVDVLMIVLLIAGAVCGSSFLPFTLRECKGGYRTSLFTAIGRGLREGSEDACLRTTTIHYMASNVMYENSPLQVRT
jgi:hypothetical protein